MAMRADLKLRLFDVSEQLSRQIIQRSIAIPSIPMDHPGLYIKAIRFVRSIISNESKLASNAQSIRPERSQYI